MAVELLGAGNDRIDFGDIAALAGKTALTVAFTLLPDNNTDVLRLLSQWGNTAASEQCFLSATAFARRPGIVVYNGGNYFGRSCDNNVLTAGVQSRVLMTWATGTPNVIHIWVDGVDQPVSAWSGNANVASLLNSVRSVQLGHETDEAIDGVDGDYAELAIWDVVVPNWFAIAYTTHGLSPRFCRNGGILYAPLWNTGTLNDEWGGIAGAQVGAANAAHPRVFYPSPPALPPAPGSAAAADGTIYKTWDRFTTVGRLRPATGFPAAPVGGKAKMNAIGRRVLLADVDERVLAIASDAGTPKETALLGAGSAWTAPDAVGAGLGVAPRIYPLTDQLWFALNGTGSAQFASGPGRRTENGGGTWGATPDPRPAGDGIVQFARDVGGRVWCVVFHSALDNAYVYWSDDDGDTWNLSRTIQDGLLDAVWKIMPHPTNQNILAVISYNTVPNQGSINYTLNRGTTWAANSDTDIRRGSTDLLYDAMLLSNNRIVVIGPLNAAGASSPSVARYSDDWGANWSVAFSVAGANVRFSSLFVSPGGTRLGFVYVEDRAASPGDWHLALSTNGGSSFTVTALAVELETLWTTDVDSDGFLSTMSPERDALYCILRKGPNSQAFRLTPISAAGVWADITTDLDQALDYNIKGMAVIPRVGA